MKRLLFAFATLFVAAPAYAGSVTFGVSSTSPAVNASKSYVVSDADMVKFYNWVQATYTAPACVPVPPATTCVTTPFTLAQSLQAWANGLMQGTIANVQSWQASGAAATASAGVAPISAQ